MSTRLKNDGKTITKKARELRKKKDLEVPKGKSNIRGISNSFAVLDNDVLMHKARTTVILLGSSEASVVNNIEAIKDVEVNRLSNFHLSNPDKFLPGNIDVSGSEFVGTETHNSEDDVHVASLCSSEGESAGSPWIEATGRRSGSRRKLNFHK